MPNLLASRDICILNRPSESTAIPKITQIKFIRLEGFLKSMIPKIIVRIPKAKSYWNAKRYRSLENNPGFSQHRTKSSGYRREYRSPFGDTRKYNQ